MLLPLSTLIFSLLPLVLTHPLTLTYTPLSSLNPHPLAILTLSPPLLTAYTPPPPSSTPLRLSFSPSTTITASTSSTLTLASALHLPGSYFRILLSRLDNTTLSVSYHPGPNGLSNQKESASNSAAGTDHTAWPSVQVAYAAAAPQPVLNRPVVASKDGGGQEAEVEKTFLQK
ncbi:hypothetical protein MMC17_006321 [Xylographa soralifera]|nr:hypothetical protein [Xylographa soralifera]